MTPRRCFDCGARAADGADVRECASCAFKFCEDHAATVGGVTKCEECKSATATEDAVAERLYEACRATENARRAGRISAQVCSWADATIGVRLQWRDYARATLAWTESKVSVALNEVGRVRESLDDDEFAAIVARVMGKEAPHA